MTTPLRWLAEVVVRRPGAVAFAVALVTAGALALLPRFRVDPNVASLLPEGHEAVELLAATTLGERSARTLFLVVQPSGARDFERELEDFSAELRRSPLLQLLCALVSFLLLLAHFLLPLLFLLGGGVLA